MALCIVTIPKQHRHVSAHMPDSAIINKFFNQDRPPTPGGWHYFFNPQERKDLVKCYSPHEVFEIISRHRINNKIFTSDVDLWGELWAYWCAQEPHRCSAQMPSVATRAKNAVGAVARVAKAAVTGGKILSSNPTERQAICLACQHYAVESGTCRQCGCFTKAKTILETETCPLGHW
jgi:hypothetical protein